ncbi:hypothetical protein [Desertimonas flava]|uniref:hypothetical protein n=1 Tax=Desertimonas flava TaxID=2064846 RepID=UPI000E350CE5|nr:hypothetical protein [Desertimonas flava]
MSDNFRRSRDTADDGPPDADDGLSDEFDIEALRGGGAADVGGEDPWSTDDAVSFDDEPGLFDDGVLGGVDGRLDESFHDSPDDGPDGGWASDASI